MQSHQQTIVNLVDYCCNQHPEITQFILEKHKQMLSDVIVNIHGNKVAYGLFKGLKFIEESHWGSSDKGTMILGLYEQEVLNEFLNIPERYTIFIDLGAADGYYGVGVLINKLFKKSYCYEITEAGRSVIEKTAIFNNVADKVVIRGEATKNIADEIPSSEINDSVLLVDIEGSEFDLLSSEFFKSFRSSIILVELHDFIYPDGEERIHRLILNSKDTHSVRLIPMGSRDLSTFCELKHWNDTNRWMLCSENRSQRMSWARFDPLCL